jgi:hypothetical protein
MSESIRASQLVHRISQFTDGLEIALTAALITQLIAAAASLMRGGMIRTRSG